MTSHKRLNMSQYQVPYCDVTQVKSQVFILWSVESRFHYQRFMPE